MKITIKIKDDILARRFVDFIKDIPFIEIEDKVEQKKIKETSLKDVFGIWQDKEISLEKIREKAWHSNTGII